VLPFHACVTNKCIPVNDYYACSVMDWTVQEISAVKRMNGAKLRARSSSSTTLADSDQG
jgi:hypothetical protein